MRCSSCGALYKKRSKECFECGAIEIEEPLTPSEQPKLNRTAITQEKKPPPTRQKERPKRTSSLIEFPGLTKASMPQWRKELGERVREIQERRAREAVAEPGNVVREVEETRSRSTGPLELLPPAEVPPMNPLVAAALRRIERAHVSSHCGSNAIAMAVAFEEQPEFGEDMSHMVNDASSSAISQPEQSTQSERLHNLAMVPNSVVGTPEGSEVIRKPKRLIAGDLNDPALNYLDAIPIPTLHVGKRGYRSAAIPFRVLSGVVDLVVIVLLSLPLAAVIKLTELNWQDRRAITFALGTGFIVGFLYLTISIALTGRTLGMKVFTLRVVDDRTGLIPTGRQAAGRAAIYLLSLAFAGIALMYVFFDEEKHTAHDRYTRTAVIRV